MIHYLHLAIGITNGKHYLIYRNGCEVLVDYPNFKKIHNFSNKRALLETNEDKKGYINKKGEFVIQPTFSRAYSFTSNVACVMDTSGFWGIIDTLGNWTIKPSYKHISPFEDGGDWTIALDRTHKTIILYKNGEVRLLGNCYSLRNVSNNLAMASMHFTHKEIKKNKEKGTCNTGFINRDIKWQIYPEYSYANNFHDGYAVVRKNRLWGFIDTNGLWAIKPQFASAFNMFKVDSDETEIIEKTTTVDDIIRYFDILEYLNFNPSKKNWTSFYEQDIYFTKWLLSFRHDTTNCGLWSKVDNIIPQNNNLNKSDSEIARLLIIEFLDGNSSNIFNQKDKSYEFIEEFLNKNSTLKVKALRDKWARLSNS